jgi:hypothetical protein
MVTREGGRSEGSGGGGFLLASVSVVTEMTTKTTPAMIAVSTRQLVSQTDRIEARKLIQ